MGKNRFGLKHNEFYSSPVHLKIRITGQQHCEQPILSSIYKTAYNVWEAVLL